MSLNVLNIPNKLHDAPSKEPQFALSLKNHKNKEVFFPNPKASRLALALMNQGAVNGGAACHWGGPSAMIEVWTALHAHLFQSPKWFNQFNFVNDIGHAENGIYAIRALWGFGDLTLDSLKGFRSIESKLTGHGESHLYPEGVILSNGPLSSALPQAQGLAVADKLSGVNRTTIVSISDGACMEGEAKEALASIPGLFKKGKLNPFILLISDNNTKLGGRIDNDSFSMAPTFDSLETLGWKVMTVQNGHELGELFSLFDKVLSSSHEAPLAIRIKTIKGYGLKSTMESSSGGHGYPLKAYDENLFNLLKELWGDESYPDVFKDWAQNLVKKPTVNKNEPSIKKDKIQIGISSALIECTEKGLPVFSLSSDLAGSTGVKAFQAKFPDRFIDVGIAEANMVSMAVGLSKAGFIPVVDTFAAFGVTKGNLPLVMGALSDAPIIGIFSHTGFQDAADGASHQSLTYISALSSIPNLEIINLACADEAHFYLTEAITLMQKKREKGEKVSSFIFFLGRENFPLNYHQNTLEFDQPQLIASGKDALIVTTGSLVPEAIEAVDNLKKEGISVGLIHHPFVKSKNVTIIKDELIKSQGRLLTVEDHQVIGGMGSLLSHQLLLQGAQFHLKSLGVKGEFGQSSYTASDLYHKHELTHHWIEKGIKELMATPTCND